MRRSALLPLLVVAFAACGRQSRPPEAPAARLLPVPPLAPGLRLTIAPNLPDVPADDLPETTQRIAEIVGLESGRMRVKWTGRVRRESPESAERRASWLRARTAAGSHDQPPPPVPPLFEEEEVTGTLEFPQFGTGQALLLPGLWPEGRAVLRGSSGLWLAAGALGEITGSRRVAVPFLKARALRDPAAALLERATDIAREREPGVADECRLLPSPGRSPLTVDGVEGEVATLRLSSWFGTFEVLPDPKNPIVLAVEPAPTGSGLMPLFAPARVLRMLLAYRVVAIDTRPAARMTESTR